MEGRSIRASVKIDSEIDQEIDSAKRMEATWVAVGANDWIVAGDGRLMEDRWKIDGDRLTNAKK